MRRAPAADPAIDHEMRDMDPLRRKLASDYCASPRNANLPIANGTDSL